MDFVTSVVVRAAAAAAAPPLLFLLLFAIAVAVAVAGVAADVLSSRHCALFSGGQTRAHDDDDDGLWALCAALGMRCWE